MFAFLCFSSLPPLIILLAHVDFSFPLHYYPLSLPFTPSFLPLVFPSPSIHAPLIPTGIVIPSPQRRLNDFILPRLCLLLLMMCLVPSYFDVDYQSLPVCVCGVSVCVCVQSGEEEIMCEQFRVSNNRGRVEMIHKHPFFMCCQLASPRSVRCLFETPPV